MVLGLQQSHSSWDQGHKIPVVASEDKDPRLVLRVKKEKKKVESVVIAV